MRMWASTLGQLGLRAEVWQGSPLEQLPHAGARAETSSLSDSRSYEMARKGYTSAARILVGIEAAWPGQTLPTAAASVC